MLDLNDVALFVQTSDSGSFAEASRRLGMPSNTISRRVQQLEAHLGTRLLHRTTRQLTLTHAGQAFYEQCSGAVGSLVGAGELLLSESLEPTGTLRIAAMADFFDFFLMDWVSDFLNMYPKVSVDFVLSDARADLIADRIDIAFRGGSLPDVGYIGRQLIGGDNEGLVASPSYLEKRGSPDSLDQLHAHDCIGFSQPSGLTRWLLTGPDGQEREVTVKTKVSANTAQALRKAALAGLGVALLPPAIAKFDLKVERLIPVLPQYHRNGHGLHVLYPTRQQLPRAVSAFIDLVVVKLTEQAFPACS